MPRGHRDRVFPPGVFGKVQELFRGTEDISERAWNYLYRYMRPRRWAVAVFVSIPGFFDFCRRAKYLPDGRKCQNTAAPAKTPHPLKCKAGMRSVI